MKYSRFSALSPFAVATVALGGIGIFTSTVIAPLIAVAAILVSGVVAACADHVVTELRRTVPQDGR